MEQERMPIVDGAIDKLAAALVAAQGALTNPPKTKTVHAGAKRYSFAPLPEIIDAIRPVLAKHGLAVVQLVQGRTLETRLVHASGQWIGAVYTLPSIEDSQAMGSAITYARRYSLCAIVGIAAEDDEDAEAATEAEHSANSVEEEAKRAEAKKKLEELKAKGKLSSAYDGHVLKPGEEVKAPVEGEATPPEEPAKGLLGIASPLAEKMKQYGITREKLKDYYVGKGHFPDTMDPEKLPSDYVNGLMQAQNWLKAVKAMKGAKLT